MLGIFISHGLYCLLQNLRGAFYKFDELHKGSLTKQSFRRLLDSFMCIMTNEQFDEFCKKHGITKQTRISYPEFLDRFEVRDTVEGHKWLKSVHRYVKMVHIYGNISIYVDFNKK